MFGGYDLIIFPEGVRSRDGSMLPFKNGTANLSIMCNIPILPIRINGGFEIFPRHIKKPRKKNKNGEKYTLEILIGKPIWSGEMGVNQLTEKLKNTIAMMEKEKI